MSEILANIVVDSVQQNISLSDNQIQFTPNDIQLNIFTGAGPVAAGSNRQVQYNNAGSLGGSNAFIFNNTNNTVTIANLVTTNVSNLGNIGNVKITGGTNQYYLQTDGTGNLTWAIGPGNITGNGTPGGANTQIQFNDGGANFGGAAGFTFNKTSNAVNMPGDLTVAGNISGVVANANYSTYAGTVINGAQPNITSVGTLANLSVNGTTASNVFSASGNIISFGYFVGDGSQLGNIFAFQLGNGNSNITVPTTNGPIIANVGGVANVMVLQNNLISFGQNVTANLITATLNGAATTSGTVTTNAQPNITSLGTLTGLTINGTSNLGGIGNVKITGGTNGQFIQTDGNGNLSYATLSTSGISNGTSNVTIPIANGNVITAVNGSNIFTVTSTPVIGANLTGTLTITSTLRVPTANVTSQLNVANITITSGSGIALGNGASAVSTGVALGFNTTANTANSVAIGWGAKATGRSTTVGYGAGGGGVFGLDNTFIGQQAGGVGNANQWGGSTFVGAYAGARQDGAYNVAVGYAAGAGFYGNGVISIGQAGGAVAIGTNAGRIAQNANSIAIGHQAGEVNQGENSIAIGASTGGNQVFNSITIDATNSGLSANIPNSLFVKPIRDVTGVPGFTVQLYYNPTTGEIGYK